MDLDQFFSCETQLVITLQDLCKNCDSGKQTGVAILDFSKAFDKVAPNRLLHELDSYGTTENLHLWLQTFRTEQHMKIVIEGEESHEVPVDSGVPQGTVL